MASVDEEDLANSVDFEFYDPGEPKHQENLVFNKVYDKPPPGRQRSSSSLISSGTLNNKVCFESPAGTNNTNVEQEPREVIGFGDLALKNRKNGPVLLTNGTGEEKEEYGLRGTKNNGDATVEEEGDDDDEDVFNFKFVSPEENDFQSGLDVSISDDTEDEEDDGYSDNNADLLVDDRARITDDERNGDARRRTDTSKDGDVLDYSTLEADKSTGDNRGFDIGRKTRQNLGNASPRINNSIVLPRVEDNNQHHHHEQHQYGINVSFPSETVNNDSNNESDLSSLDDDDDDSEEDADEVCCSGDGGDESTDDDDNPNNSSSNTENDVGSVVKSLGKNGPTPPRKIVLGKNGLSFSERCCVQKSRRNNSNNRVVSSSNNKKSDMNCNTIKRRGGLEEDDEDEDDCSSASEMTDVSPLASSAENSPTLARKYKSPTLTKDECISFSANKNNGITKNGFCCSNGTASGHGDMDMNVIMKAVEEISKDDEDADERWKRCNSKISSTSSSSSPNRKRNNNMSSVHSNSPSYTNDRERQIERENERLLSQLLKLSSSAKNYKVHLKAKVSHSAINRQREQRRIEKENEALLRRLQSAKVSRGLSRDEQLKDFNSKHVKCPKNKATRNGSPFKRPFTAASSSSRNSIISVGSDANYKRSVFLQSTSEINSRPEWVTKW